MTYENISQHDTRLIAARICHARAVKLISKRVPENSTEWKEFMKWAKKVCPERHSIPGEIVMKGF